MVAVQHAWWEVPRRVIARRVKELNFVHDTLRDGLPEGVEVKRESTKYLPDSLVVYVDGIREFRHNNFGGRGVEAVIQWIEDYRTESEDIMGISAKGLQLLKELARNQGGVARQALDYHGTVFAALKAKTPALITEKDGIVIITNAGMEEVRGLPEFDEAVGGGAAEESVNVPVFVGAAVEVLTAEEVRQMMAELPNFAPNKLVRLVLGDGVKLADVAKHCGSEVMAMGGVVIKLELVPALLVELYPALAKLLEGMDAIGAPYVVYGDLAIVVERPLVDVDEEIDFELA